MGDRYIIEQDEYFTIIDTHDKPINWIVCFCENKESAELIIEALTVMHQVNEGYY
tara:strand:+ start:214 stop:378 length:165 start_codon:yes stop_codon:yes gene_type:complete